ncbi:MAG TPA: diphthine synthase [Thermoplasmataceae archaeon]|nr:diphthine synthase [Thermoplasmatales archaeon AK]HLH86309.1 diphthine synthase [Thermoplasmataceae archaeon]
MIHVLGLGLRGAGSMTLDELEIASRCDSVFLESYTSVIDESEIEKLSRRIGRTIEILNRESMEHSGWIIERGRREDVAILVVGDPLAATTHSQLRLDAKKSGVDIEFYENASILTRAPSLTGLMLYRFGPPVSLPRITGHYRPKSVLLKIKRNIENDMHTLLLLDLAEGKTLTPSEACDILLTLENEHMVGAISKSMKVIVLISVSRRDQKILSGTVDAIIRNRIEGSPACIVIPATISDVEKTFVAEFTEALQD